MLGHASGLKDDYEELDPMLSEMYSDDLAPLLKSVCRDAKVEDPLQWIIDEKLDDQESMFMDGMGSVSISFFLSHILFG